MGQDFFPLLDHDSHDITSITLISRRIYEDIIDEVDREEEFCLKQELRLTIKSTINIRKQTFNDFDRL